MLQRKAHTAELIKKKKTTFCTIKELCKWSFQVQLLKCVDFSGHSGQKRYDHPAWRREALDPAAADRLHLFWKRVRAECFVQCFWTASLDCIFFVFVCFQTAVCRMHGDDSMYVTGIVTLRCN